jgi:hypothetical protein
MSSRGQVKRALEWADWLAKPRHQRKDPPGCVTCGGKADRMMARGEPGFACRHEPLRIDDATMARARSGAKGAAI